MSNATLIYTIETLARNAWPAKETSTLDGWRLRFNDGVTSRANSVWPNEAAKENSLPLPKRIQQVEHLYAQHHLPACYQICPIVQPSNLDKRLAQLGYISHSRTNVQTAEIKQALSKSIYSPFYKFTTTNQVNMSWFDMQDDTVLTPQTIRDREIRLAIMQRIQPQTIYVEARVGQTGVAQGIGVVEKGWLGIFSLYTAPQWRGQGAASAVMQTLLRQGIAAGATQTYLQVTANNPKANALYKRLSYNTCYQYHYRVQSD